MLRSNGNSYPQRRLIVAQDHNVRLLQCFGAAQLLRFARGAELEGFLGMRRPLAVLAEIRQAFAALKDNFVGHSELRNRMPVEKSVAAECGYSVFATLSQSMQEASGDYGGISQRLGNQPRSETAESIGIDSTSIPQCHKAEILAFLFHPDNNLWRIKPFRICLRQ